MKKTGLVRTLKKIRLYIFSNIENLYKLVLYIYFPILFYFFLL